MGPVDRLAEESPVLAGIVGASVQGRVALGARAGARVRRLGDARDTPTVTSRGPRQAHLEGFDLHANVWVGANDRAGLERLCRLCGAPHNRQYADLGVMRSSRLRGWEER